MTKSQNRIAARMIAGMMLKDADMIAYIGSDVSDDDAEKIMAEVHSIARRILGRLPSYIATTPGIIDFVIKNK